jgi:hypothetical protein
VAASKPDHGGSGWAVLVDGLLDERSLVAGVPVDPAGQEEEPGHALANVVGMVGPTVVVAADEAPQADGARQVEEHDGVRVGEAGVEVLDVAALDDPSVAAGEVALELTERVVWAATVLAPVIR